MAIKWLVRYKTTSRWKKTSLKVTIAAIPKEFQLYGNGAVAGVASYLICKSMAMFKAMNMDEVALIADTQNPTGAMRLYTNLGYQAYRTIFDLRKPLTFDE